jgi:membrane protease YdiL (CAAX protease family)
MPHGATGSPRRHDEPPPAPARLDGLRGWGAAVLVLVATAAIVAVALSAPVFVDLAVSLLGGAPLTEIGANGEPRSNWTHLIAFQVTVIALTVLMADPRGRDTPGALAWRPSQGHRSWLTPFIVTTLASLIIAAIVFTFFPETVARDLEPIRQMVRDAPLWLAFVALAVGAPLAEELLFRGYLLGRLTKTPLGVLGGALVANAAWTALHFGYSWLSLADVFVAGLFFTWALWRTRSIWVPIAFHAIYNAAVLFIVLIPNTSDAVRAGLTSTVISGLPV